MPITDGMLSQLQLIDLKTDHRAYLSHLSLNYLSTTLLLLSTVLSLMSFAPAPRHTSADALSCALPCLRQSQVTIENQAAV